LRFAIRHFKSRGQAVIVVLLVACVLLLNALAASPALHELLHKDADSSVHQCAVTMFLHGKVDSARVSVSPVVAMNAIETTPQILFSVFVSTTEGLPAGRAPPDAVFSPV
jgi:hypothetical protein